MVVNKGLEVSDLYFMAEVTSTLHVCVHIHLLRRELSEELLNLFVVLKLVLGYSQDVVGLRLGHKTALDAQPLERDTLPAAVDKLLFRVHHLPALCFKLANLHG